jgi:hypothetical protein
MALVTGNDGEVVVATTTYATESWSLSEKVSVRNGDSSANAGGYSIKSVGAFKDWSGSFVILLDDADDGPAVNTSATIKLYITSAKYYTGTVIITGNDPGVEVKGGDYAKHTISFEGSGTLTPPA